MRPGTLEADAVFRAISIAGVVNCPLYIVHISAAEALDPIDRARAKGQAVFTETCPQYLTLTDQTLRQKGPLAKIGPPLRTEKDNAALWQALRNGLIDVVASDHAPKRKKVEDDFFKAPFGSPAAETLFVVPYQKGVNEGRIDICTLVRSMTATPAKIFGLYPRKGAITQGADADLVLFDPTRSWTITAQNQHSKAGYTLYEGLECLGAPTLVMQRGCVVMEENNILSNSGRGCFLKTRPACG